MKRHSDGLRGRREGGGCDEVQKDRGTGMTPQSRITECGGDPKDVLRGRGSVMTLQA